MTDSTSSPRPLYVQATRAAALGLAINLALGIGKLVAGWLGQSFALVSDAVNSLGDSLSSVITLAALWYAQQPPDDEHPYGHTRVETVAGAYVAIVILFSALWVAWEATQRMFVLQATPPAWTLWVAGANAVIKESLYWYKRGVGKRTNSTAILANAWDHRSDALCSLAVLFGLGIVRAGGGAWGWADEAAALVVVVAIMFTAGKLLTQSTRELLDPQADEAVVAEVRALASQTPGVANVEKLWVRKTGIEYLVDIHIQVDARTPVDEGHRIGHEVKDRLVSGFPAVRDVLVHLEPFPHRHDAEES